VEQFADYSHAIAAMGLTVIFGLLLSPVTALAKMAKGTAAGANPEADYGDQTYRLNRSYLNLTEMMGFFVAATVSAMVAGADPTWVNWLAAIFFVTRILHFVVHLLGIGPMNFGPRTFLFVGGWACALVLAILAVLAVV